jgi:hypothetical protein
VTFSGPLAAERIREAVYAEIECLPDFDPALLQLMEEELGKTGDDRARQMSELNQQLRNVERQLAAILDFIKRGSGESESAVLREELSRLEKQKNKLRYELDLLERQPAQMVEIPSVDQIRVLARRSLDDLDLEDPEFARQLRKSVPRIVVFPVRLCDDGAIVLRARFRLRLWNLLPNPQQQQALRTPLEKLLTVDLFDPPQRELFRQRVLKARAEGKTERAVATEFGITVTAAQKAAVLQRRMDELGISDPYIPVTQPPAGSRKMCRHLHRAYRFEPLNGAGEV